MGASAASTSMFPAAPHFTGHYLAQKLAHSKATFCFIARNPRDNMKSSYARCSFIPQLVISHMIRQKNACSFLRRIKPLFIMPLVSTIIYYSLTTCNTYHGLVCKNPLMASIILYGLSSVLHNVCPLGSVGDDGGRLRNSSSLLSSATSSNVSCNFSRPAPFGASSSCAASPILSPWSLESQSWHPLCRWI